MKTTLSPKALTVLRAIARGRLTTRAACKCGLECRILTIGNYKFFARSIAAFRSAAGDVARGRVVLEIFPGFAGNEALGFDLDGKIWVAQQDECNDWATRLSAKHFKDTPGMNAMVCHLIHLVEVMLLALTPEQVKELNAAMRVTTKLPYGAGPDAKDEDVPF